MNAGMSTNLVVKIHPVVLFTICDSYERRNDSQYRVIGTLLVFCVPPNLDKLPAEHFQLFEVMLQNTEYNSAPGVSSILSINSSLNGEEIVNQQHSEAPRNHHLLGRCVHEKGAVEVTNCLCIPHNESEDEVAVDMEFAKAMYELHKKVNPSEVIVGWYATGPDVTGHSVLIHDYYSRETNNPIHLTVDTSLSEGRVAWKAFISVPFGVPNKNTGTMFTPCRVEIVGYEPELVGMKICQKTKHNKQRSAEIVPDLDMIYNAIQEMIQLTDTVISYVDDVLSNRKSADSSVGRTLMDIIQSIPQMDADLFIDMVNTSMKDILMIVYLSQLIRSQTALQEKVALL